MKNICSISLYGLIFGMIGTTLGGIIGSFLNIKSHKYFSFILELAAGLMSSIICFDLIPEGLNLINISLCILGIIIGIICMIFCSQIINNYSNKLSKLKSNNLFKTSIIIATGLAIHNFPEGLAIGAGFEASNSLGLKLAIVIAIHDIPEGISISLPLKNSGTQKYKAILLTALSGLTTGIGALFGSIFANISTQFIGISLCFAAGAMLYIISCELIPESKKIYTGRFSSLGNILGFLLGLLSQNIV